MALLRFALLCFLLVFGALTPFRAQAQTLTFGTYSDFQGFDLARVRAFSPNTTLLASAVMEGLFAYDYENNDAIVPRLGLSFEEAPDRLSAIVKLRPNVRFHDGTPFNADAVVYHFSRILDPQLGIGLAETLFKPLEKVEAVDDLTVRFVLRHPWSTLQSTLAVDQAMNMIGSPTGLRSDPEAFNRRPIGTGPFIFREWRSGDRVVLERNKDYWDAGLPKLDQVVYRIMLDENTRFQALKAGELDIAWIDNAGQVAEARQSSNLKVWENRGTGGIVWLFNASKPPFDDVKARAAVVHAFNEQALIDGFFLGGAEVAREFFPHTRWACPGLKWRGYDPNRAKDLVKQLGGKLSFSMLGYGTPPGRRVSSIVQQFQEASGIDVKVELIELVQLIRRVFSTDFQMSQWRLGDYGGDPDIFFTSATFNALKYKNPRIEELLSKAQREKDFEARRQLYCEVSALFSEDAVMLIPDHTYDYLVAHTRVKDVSRNVGNLLRVRSVRIEKDK